MKISNLNEFYNYVRTNPTLNGNANFMTICVCVDQVKNICSCKAKEKNQKLFECTNKYKQLINELNVESINLLFNTTSDKSIEFYENSEFIKTISIES